MIKMKNNNKIANYDNVLEISIDGAGEYQTNQYEATRGDIILDRLANTNYELISESKLQGWGDYHTIVTYLVDGQEKHFFLADV